MNIYLTARYGRRQELADLAREQEALGVTVTSRWYNKPPELYPRTNFGGQAAITNISEEDLVDIYRAQAHLFGDNQCVSGRAMPLDLRTARPRYPPRCCKVS